MIELTVIMTFMFFSGLGAGTRALFGIYKVYTNMVVFSIDWHRVGIEVVASIFFGAFFTILLQEVGVFKVTLDALSMVAGFFGADLVSVLGKKIGITKSMQIKVTEEQVEWAGFNDRQMRILVYMRTHKRMTNKLYQMITGASGCTSKRDLGHLVRENKFKRIGWGKGTYYESA